MYPTKHTIDAAFQTLRAAFPGHSISIQPHCWHHSHKRDPECYVQLSILPAVRSNDPIDPEGKCSLFTGPTLNAAVTMALKCLEPNLDDTAEFEVQKVLVAH